MQKEENNFIINGELYLKRGPEIFNQNTGQLEDKINQLEFDVSKENPDFSKLPQLNAYKNLNDMIESIKGKIDYSGTDSFWQLYTINGINCKLCECMNLYGLERNYNSPQKINADFIKLSEFLNKATFGGRKFKRTKPIISMMNKTDKSYMPIDNDIYATKYIVLYATQDLFLIKRIDGVLGEKYALINSGYTLDGNYQFFGPVYDEYRDKNKVYQEILTQVSEYNKGKGRK